MSDCPRTDVAIDRCSKQNLVATSYMVNVSMQLERELTKALADLDALREEMERGGVEGESQLAYIEALKNDRDVLRKERDEFEEQLIKTRTYFKTVDYLKDAPSTDGAYERAAQIFEEEDEDGDGFDSWDWHGKDCAKAIRALKDKP